MTRISSVFEGKKHAALVAYLTVGYPYPEATLEAVPLLESCGVDMVELGIPFSDPMADGVTIQKASQRALENGVTPGECLKIARLLREKVEIPLLFMSYFNPVLSYGLKPFCSRAFEAGIDGLIIPDLPLEEASTLEEIARNCNLDLIYLVAPTSSEARIREIARRSRGFIYLVSVTGVTGMREGLPPGLSGLVSRVRKYSLTPLCIGFGISTPEQAAQAAALADGVIVGSSIVHRMGTPGDWRRALAEHVGSLKKAIEKETGGRF